MLNDIFFLIFLCNCESNFFYIKRYYLILMNKRKKINFIVLIYSTFENKKFVLYILKNAIKSKKIKNTLFLLKINCFI